jgi:hypothetical protein
MAAEAPPARRWRERLARLPFLIRLLHWEFWPPQVANLPVYGFWLYYALRSRQLFFFSAANPAIETGGVLGESKKKILDQLPDSLKPATLLLPPAAPLEAALEQMALAGIAFPVVAKPDVGERGRAVEKLEDAEALRAYLAQAPGDTLVQTFVDYPEEYSILHCRLPGRDSGQITSVCQKIYLSVTGDGRSTLRELICAYPRARLQLEALKSRLRGRMEEVPAAGQRVELLPIGNHARGALFLDARHEQDEALTRVFDQISRQLQGIYLCRYDLKCSSMAALKRGEEFKILEINGVTGEPAHIYDPAYPPLRAYADLLRHWRAVYEVSREARRRGAACMSLAEALRACRAYRRIVKQYERAAPSLSAGLHKPGLLPRMNIQATHDFSNSTPSSL